MSDWVTKCPCGQNQDADGLMIQCDRCLVWQHGDCVGLFSKASVPDQYFCEQCKPQHKIHQEARRRRAEVTQARQIRIARARGRMRSERFEKDSNRATTKKHKKSRTGNKRPKTPRTPKASEASESSSSRPSREQRKIERILESFRKLDETKSRKKSTGGDNRGSRGKLERRENKNGDRKRRGRPRRVKRKAARTHQASSTIPLGKLISVSPMYLGRKAWLMRTYKKDQLLKRNSGYEQMIKVNLPLQKRVLLNYTAQQEKISQETVNGASSGSLTPKSGKEKAAAVAKSAKARPNGVNNNGLKAMATT
mmetsp:Transcript_14935/g.26845  ORF Transcript_14935/g.26845 Transcript_14935/m.26845 type:complete len:309 (-) Transcript_14935:140-1066(-)|eukprot:CAMPEP_0197525442 /NCGR_PEP_ID=MMETSP1318-20131121/12212_1 /TAXON_ID=552666 /ORGANISM="Partenskyella glossopodia, Strain RCC365" /LENGTH=308 /DNA_ID=CAMNT_0043078875 /DNA_START=80 /DNA_END=1006 /DNA_ORIENTATION=+